jgi:hypothetical protein
MAASNYKSDWLALVKDDFRTGVVKCQLVQKAARLPVRVLDDGRRQ